MLARRLGKGSHVCMSKTSHRIEDGSVILIVMANRIDDRAEGYSNLARLVWKLQVVDGFSEALSSYGSIVVKLDDPTLTHVVV